MFSQGFTYWIRQPNRAPRPAAADSPPPTPTRSRRTTPTVSPMTSPSVSPHNSEDAEIDSSTLSRWELQVGLINESPSKSAWQCNCDVFIDGVCMRDKILWY